MSRPSTAAGFDVAPSAPAEPPAHVVHHGHAPGSAIHGGALHGTGQHGNAAPVHAGGAYQGPAFTTGTGARNHGDGGQASAYAGHPSNQLLELLSKIQSGMPQQQSHPEDSARVIWTFQTSGPCSRYSQPNSSG